MLSACGGGIQPVYPSRAGMLRNLGVPGKQDRDLNEKGCEINGLLNFKNSTRDSTVTSALPSA